MDICYINPTNNIRRPIAELSKILAEEGHNITIMYPVSKQCPTEQWKANDAVKDKLIKTIPLKSWYFAPLRYNIPDIFDLVKQSKKIVRENDYIHIWEYYYPLSVIPLLVSAFNKRKKEKIILTTDGFVGYSYLPKKPFWLTPAFKIYTQLFARFLFKIPKQITTYGNALLPYAKKAGVPLEKLKVIPTGIHLERFQEVDKDKIEQLKKEFNVTDEKIILFVGMLTERKRPEIVLEISQQLLKEGYRIKTILVGEAHGDNPYQQLVPAELSEKIIFPGGRKDIPEFMRFADVLLLPSEGEGLPGVVMEAMAAGLPVVATDEGCTPDLIENGKNGLLVKMNQSKPSQMNDYQTAIKKVLDSEQLRKDFSNNSIERIQQFDWKIISKKYDELY